MRTQPRSESRPRSEAKSRSESKPRSQSAIYAGRLYSSRLYSRRALDVRARLLARHKADGRFTVVYGRTVDLSRTGAGLTLTRELTSGTAVVLSLRLPGRENPICLDAVVIRRKGFRVGLEFVQPTAEQRLLLCEFCYS